MRYFSHEPSPPLGNYVHSFWASTFSGPHPKLRILPRGTAELVINLTEDEIRIYDAGSPPRCMRFPGIVLSGAYAGALELDPMQNSSMLGVHFRPGGAFPFFGPVIGELSNKHLALDMLWGTFAGDLRERLCATKHSHNRFQILEAALLSRLRNAEHPAVSQALQIMGSIGMSQSVRAIADQVNLSQRRFIQVFTSHVGLTPKRLSRILRFQYVKGTVKQSATPDWCQAALSSGYYDQSHLIKDFQEFTGLSPTDFCLSIAKQQSNLHSAAILSHANPMPEHFIPLIG